jgi:hypothetical protein
MAKPPDKFPEAGSSEASSSEASHSEASPSEAMAAVVGRARLLMVIAAATTAIAIAAVVAVIGYRFFAERGSISGTITNGTVFLPPNAHVLSMTISNGRIFVTLDVAGASEVRIFDLNTLQQVGELHFTNQH